MKENFEMPVVTASESELGTENIESLADWRELKQMAGSQAKEQLDVHSPAYMSLSPNEQIRELHSLIEVLSDNNKNRFIAAELGKQLEVLIETTRSTSRLAQLQAA